MKALPKFWKRIFKPEAEIHKLRANQHKISKRRREKGWYIRNSSIKEIESFFEFSISTNIKNEILKRKATGIKRKVEVLDVGFGNGRALKDLKEQFKNDIKTTGIALEKYGEYSGVDRKIFGDFLKVNPKSKYDFIFSHYGATLHGKLRVTLIEKVVKLLKPEGTAILHLGALDSFMKDEIETMLFQNGLRRKKDYKIQRSLSEWTNKIIIKKPKRIIP